MSLNTMNFLGAAIAAAMVAGFGSIGCGNTRGNDAKLSETDSAGSATSGAGSTSGAMTTVAGSSTGGTTGGGIKLDIGNSGGNGCDVDGTCDLIDLLFVIDNSGSMGEEQRNLAANMAKLVDQLQMLQDSKGNAISPNVNIMVTTTDMGHPLCTPFQKPDYTPRQGAPVYDGCNARINRFTGLEVDNPISIPEACTDNCPVDISPGDQFIHFDPMGTNVPNDDVAAALSCVGPQGIDGCGYEAPLESMLQAINPTACWNDPKQDKCKSDPEWGQFHRPFLRDGATLAVTIISDEADCSVAPPGGFTFFTDDDTYWETSPEAGVKQATSAVCWNAGVTCTDSNMDGVYESCVTADNNVLHPTSRYKEYLQYLKQTHGKEVIMLGIMGVPPVTEHDKNPPFEPTKGGVFALEYRDWIDGEYPMGDILPDDFMNGVTAADKQFDYGHIGPGCTGQDDMGNFTGQGIPPVRVKEVCESLDYTDANGMDQVRCCMESICSQDFSPAIRCLTGIIQDAIAPVG